MTALIGTVSGVRSLDGAVLLESNQVSHIARLGDHWWAVDVEGGIYRDGEEFARMPDDTLAHCVQPTDQTLWVGADRARLFTVDGDKVVEDEFFAEAPGRDSWYTPWGAPADIRSMTLDADHTLYINVHVGGVIRYDNAGPVPTIDISADVHQVVAHPTKKGVVFAACAYGLAASHNGHDFEIRSDGLHGAYCRAVAVMDDLVLVSASTGPTTRRARLYRGDPWQGDFEPLTGGLPEWFDDNVDTHCVLVRDGSAYVGHGDTVWHSGDSGDTWELAVSGLDPITCIG